MPVNPIPDDYPQVIPYLTVDGANDAITFYTKVLGAKERMRMDGPGGKVAHAEIEIGRGMVMLSDEFPEMGGKSPKTVGGTAVTVMAYVEDVDDVFRRALEGGAKAVRPVENQFYGDRSGQFEDPFGHLWYIATHVEDISEEEMARRAGEAMGGADA
jgi:PhnB protein